MGKMGIGIYDTGMCVCGIWIMLNELVWGGVTMHFGIELNFGLFFFF